MKECVEVSIDFIIRDCVYLGGGDILVGHKSTNQGYEYAIRRSVLSYIYQ